MSFLDEVEVILASGGGGAGCLSFRRERRLPRGGPDGGNGGKGGDLYLVGREDLTTLDYLGGQRRFAAGKGAPGGNALCHGRNGEDFHFKLPVGTLVRESERGHVLAEILEPDQPILLLQGGKGGRGNASFKGPKHQTPRRVQLGLPGEERRVRLELKLLADAGLLGLPNAGKSTLLTALSAAHPKVANYPFTTLSPKVGVVEFDYETLTVADLPGILEGAHEGRGLGDRFLRHIERTRVLLHLLDAGETSIEEMLDSYETVRREIAEFGRQLEAKPELVVLTKADARPGEMPRAEIEARLGRAVHVVSAHDGTGIPSLIQAIFAAVQGASSES